MTTTNLNQDGIAAARDAAQAVHDDVLARHATLLREGAQIQQDAARDQEHFRVAAATVHRQHQDNAAVNAEELQQVNSILGPAAVPDQPAAPQPTNPPAGNGNGGGANDGNTQVQPATPAQARNGDDYSFVPQNVRHWLFCLVGAVIGFLIGSASRSVIWNEHFYPSLQEPGNTHNFWVFVWIVAWTVLGFAVGGLVYFWTQARHRREH